MLKIYLKGLFILFLYLQSVTCISAQVTYPGVKQTMNDTILKFEAKPELGFNYPYYIRIPKGVDTEITQFLLVELNNTGNNDTLSFHERNAFMQAKKNSLGSSLCRELYLPFLMPVFPRPATDWKIYTHAFDRDAALIQDGEMKRLDLQLIAMIEDAKTQLLQYEIKLHDKILLNGFSASGTFANRFTIIHPEKVAGVACGGINAMAILPIKTLEKHDLNYPLGINDFEKIFDKSVDFDSYRLVPQFLYMGENDHNDAVLYDDAYDESERITVFESLGKTLIPTRWNKCESVLKEENIEATFKTYSGIGHETNQEVFKDVYAFFKNIIDGHVE